MARGAAGAGCCRFGTQPHGIGATGVEVEKLPQSRTSFGLDQVLTLWTGPDLNWGPGPGKGRNKVEPVHHW